MIIATTLRKLPLRQDEQRVREINTVLPTHLYFVSDVRVRFMDFLLVGEERLLEVKREERYAFYAFQPGRTTSRMVIRLAAECSTYSTRVSMWPFVKG